MGLTAPCEPECSKEQPGGKGQRKRNTAPIISEHAATAVFAACQLRYKLPVLSWPCMLTARVTLSGGQGNSFLNSVRHHALRCVKLHILHAIMNAGMCMQRFITLASPFSHRGLLAAGSHTRVTEQAILDKRVLKHVCVQTNKYDGMARSSLSLVAGRLKVQLMTECEVYRYGNSYVPGAQSWLRCSRDCHKL